MALSSNPISAPFVRCPAGRRGGRAPARARSGDARRGRAPPPRRARLARPPPHATRRAWHATCPPGRARARAPVSSAPTATPPTLPPHLPARQNAGSLGRCYSGADSCSAVQPRRGRPDRRRKRLPNDYEVLIMLDPELTEARQEEIVVRARELIEQGG